jgi:hypothetical protein
MCLEEGRRAMAVIEEGQLKGSFKGFHNRETIFEFRNGRTWRQNQYKILLALWRPCRERRGASGAGVEAPWGAEGK